MNFNSKNIDRKIGPKFGEKDSILNDPERIFSYGNLLPNDFQPFTSIKSSKLNDVVSKDFFL